MENVSNYHLLSDAEKKLADIKLGRAQPVLTPPKEAKK